MRSTMVIAACALVLSGCASSRPTFGGNGCWRVVGYRLNGDPVYSTDACLPPMAESNGNGDGPGGHGGHGGRGY
jgi:hypothetical protein